MREVVIQNVGPIERLAIPLPDAGVVVLHGRNGVGKSHALAAVDSLVGGRGKVPCRDGAKNGIVEGVGAKITIGRSTRRTGEAEVVTLEGRLDISQLVAPPIKDEESADRTRIKALIQLSGASADPKAFTSILPNDIALGELVSPTDLERDDPVTLAGKIKRALEAEARRFEKIAEDAEAKAAGIEATIDEEALEAGLDRASAEAELQQALVQLRELETRDEEARNRRSQVEKSKQLLAHLRSQIPPDQSIAGLEAEESELNDKIQRLQQALAVAQERRQQVRRQLSQARTVASQIAQLESIVGEVPEAVPAETIEAARKAVEEARRRHEAAIGSDRARQLAVKAKEHREAADLSRWAAEAVRNVAHATDDVLSDLVGRVTSRLRVEEGRLVCDTDRGAEPFSELSPGERWRIALEIAVEQLGKGGIVTVPQEAWEALDPINRAEIAEIAKEVGVVILTAEADDHQQITAEVVV